MNILQILIFVACLAVLIVNFLTWRSVKKTCELLEQSRKQVIHVGNLAPGESVEIPIRFKEANFNPPPDHPRPHMPPRPIPPGTRQVREDNRNRRNNE